MSKVQDDEVGDGTTSVTVLAAELLRVMYYIFSNVFIFGSVVLWLSYPKTWKYCSVTGHFLDFALSRIQHCLIVRFSPLKSFSTTLRGKKRHVKFCCYVHKAWIHNVALNTTYWRLPNSKLEITMWERCQKWGTLLSKAVPVNLMITVPGSEIKKSEKLSHQLTKFLTKVLKKKKVWRFFVCFPTTTP